MKKKPLNTSYRDELEASCNAYMATHAPHLLEGVKAGTVSARDAYLKLVRPSLVDASTSDVGMVAVPHKSAASRFRDAIQ